MGDLIVVNDGYVSREEIEAILPPVDFDYLDAHLRQHQLITGRARDIYDLVSNELSLAAMSHFFEAAKDQYTRYTPSAEDTFKIDRAIKHIDAAFWDAVLKSTDIYDIMPSKRRDDWRNMISTMQTPPFKEDTVRETIASLYKALPDFIAERADGLFKGLSRYHVTNKSEGFSQRMIFPYGFEGSRFSSGFSSECTGMLLDLANTISIIEGDLFYDHSRMNRDLTAGIRAEGTGKWFSVYGDKFRVRAYIKGTVHVQVDENYAWKLNLLLAMANPGVLPMSACRRPNYQQANPKKIFVYSEHTLSKQMHSLFMAISNSPMVCRNSIYEVSIAGKSSAMLNDRAFMQLASAAIENIGCVLLKESDGQFKVSSTYDPSAVFRHVVETARLPEAKTHQFYPTPEDIAAIAVKALRCQSGMRVLEPSGGQGGLAVPFREKHEDCVLDIVEISPLNATVLRSKGFDPVVADFLDHAKKIAASNVRYDRIIANPPFSQGRYKSHIRAAATLLAQDGEMIAILPSLPHKNHEISPDLIVAKVHSGIPFPGTSIAVDIVRVTKKSYGGLKVAA